MTDNENLSPELAQALEKLAQAAAKHYGTPEPEYVIVSRRGAKRTCAYCTVHAIGECWRCNRRLCKTHAK
jgi:hypothetical protein